MVDNANSELVAVFTAPDETTANIVQGLLESEGIQADVEMSGTSWGGRAAVADMLSQHQTQHWGNVVVARADVGRSLELIRAYKPDDSELARQESTWSTRYSATSLRVACITCGFFSAIGAWSELSGDTIARLVFTCGAGIALLIYGLILMRWQRYVPSQFRQANMQVGSCLLIAAVLSVLFFVGELGFYEIPRDVMYTAYLLVLSASAYGTIRKYPARQGGERDA